jgi:hypothetical protein
LAQGGGPSVAASPGVSPFVTVGGSGSNFPIAQYGGDAGIAVNAAGALLKAAQGGTVYILGGIGTTYIVSTQLVFYATVNYVGDGITLKAAPTLANPFTTDPTNLYYSGHIASMTLDGNNVPGTTVLTCISTQHCTFMDVVVQNANAPLTVIAAGNSPTVWKNPSATAPAYVLVYGGKVTGITVGGAPTGNTGGVFYVAPSASLSVAWTSAPSVSISNGTGVLLIVNTAIGAALGSRKQWNGSNAFLSFAVRECSVGWVLSGALAGGQVTNNTWTESSTMFCNVCAVAYVNNCDSNTWVETQLKISGPGAVAIAFNLLNPTDDTQVYFNRHWACSIDTVNSESQIGVLINANKAKPNFILLYQPNADVPTPVVNNNRGRAFINDVVNKVKYIYSGPRKGSAWFAETYPGSNVPFVNPNPFSILMSVQGGGITAIQLNGLSLGMTSGVFPLKPGDSITCTSSGVPTVFSSLLTDF